MSANCVKNIGLMSVVVPLKDERKCLAELIRRLGQTLNAFPFQYEIILVDDGSADGSYEFIAQVASENPRVIGIQLSRNVGHQNALACGLQYANGDLIVCMDADLQHPPEMIPELLHEWEQGADVVNTVRVNAASQSKIHAWFSRTFYDLFNKMSDVKLVPGAADFRLLDRKCLDAILAMPEVTKFLRGQVSYIGFRQAFVEFNCDKRFAGERSYSFFQSVKLAIDGLTSFSGLGLSLPFYVGMAGAATVALYLVYVVAQAVMGSPVVTTGWLSSILILSIILFVNVMYLGALGSYLKKIFMEVKRRPNFFVQDVVGIDGEKTKAAAIGSPLKSLGNSSDAPLS